MGVISFLDSSEGIWHVAGWAFRQVLDDVARNFPDDHEMSEKFEQSKLYSGLIVYRLEPSFAHRIVRAIQTVVSGILNGSVQSGISEQPYGDANTIEQYFRALEDLLHILVESKTLVESQDQM